MAVSSFDTLKATSSLERTGVPRAQAERIVGTVQESTADLAANLVTKEDLAASQAATEASINNLRTKMEASINALRNKMAADLSALRAELFRALWAQGFALAAFILTGVGVLLTLFRMF